MMRQRKTSGFTLLELLIVVIIVGILAAIAIPQFVKMSKKARAAEAVAAVGTILTAEWAYYQENNQFETATLSNLAVTPSTTNFGYVLALNGTAGVKVTASGVADSPTTGITVTGTMNTNGTKTISSNQ